MRKVLYILGEMKESDLQWLVGAGRRQSIPSGTVLIRQGQTLATLYIVLEGELAVSSEGQKGRELARLGAGEVVGDIALLDARPATATVAAVKDAVVFALPHATLRPKLAADSGFAARLYRAIGIVLANRLSRAVAMIGVAGNLRPEEQVMSPDEVMPVQMDAMSLASARFVWFTSNSK